MVIELTINEYIGIRQFFTRQTFPNPDSSKFSTIKNLRHTVHILNFLFHILTTYKTVFPVTVHIIRA